MGHETAVDVLAAGTAPVTVLIEAGRTRVWGDSGRLPFEGDWRLENLAGREVRGATDGERLFLSSSAVVENGVVGSRETAFEVLVLDAKGEGNGSGGMHLVVKVDLLRRVPDAEVEDREIGKLLEQVGA